MAKEIKATLSFEAHLNCFPHGENSPEVNPLNPTSLLQFDGAAEMMRRFGLALLSLQALEFSTIEAAKSIRYWRHWKDGDAAKHNEKASVTWAAAINEIEAISNLDVPYMQSLVNRLNVARTSRNRLTHESVKNRMEYHYLFTEGGQQKKMQELKLICDPLDELIIMVSYIDRIFMTEVGLTDDLLYSMEPPHQLDQNELFHLLGERTEKTDAEQDEDAKPDNAPS